MSILFSLDNRLSLCAKMVREGVNVCDVGTDHAYLPVWLTMTGKCKSALACDIKKAPLLNGEATIQKYGAENLVKTRLSDGLSEVLENEADDIVIAGMGGELITKIMGEWHFSKDVKKHFVLQPMTKSEEVIKYLCENGFEILQQKTCVADKKVYTVISTRFSGECFSPDNVFMYFGKLTFDNESCDKLYAQAVINHLEKKALGDKKYALIANELSEYLKSV